VTDWVEREIRRMLAEVSQLGVEAVAVLPENTSLFDDVFGLDSLAGAQLIALVHEKFGVDIASEDLNLDSLETIATLRDFVRTHSEDSPDEARAVGTNRRELRL
jgi:acyl carrier protein